MIRADASEVFELGAELTATGAKAVPALTPAVKAGAQAIEGQWRDDAAATFDSHARFYPDSIDHEMVPTLGGVAADIGPNGAKKQGFLGQILETGGERSPAYLTGLGAVESQTPKVEGLVTDAIDGIMP